MPNVGKYLGYNIYFWSNENGEPVHVHVCKGKPSGGGTKLWILSNGNVIVSKNSSRIPKKELELLKAHISANAYSIISRWEKMFGYIKYYC